MSWPLVVVVRVTTHCSMACSYCGFSRDVQRVRSEISVAQLLPFCRALSNYQAETGRPILVSWLGGEPLQWNQLAPVSKLVRHDYGLALGMTTSGLGLNDPGVRQLLLECYDEVTVSVDGLAGHHDAVRQVRGGYQRIAMTVRQLREQPGGERLRIRVNMVLMRSNIEQFEEACLQLAQWRVDEITFNQLGGNDRPEYFPANRLLADQVRRFRERLPGIRERLAEWGVCIAGSDRYLDRILATTIGHQVPVADCRPGSHFLFVDEAGRVSPCSFTSNIYSCPLSELTQASHIVALADILAAKRRANPCVACQDCHATHIYDKFAQPELLPIGNVHRVQEFPPARLPGSDQPAAVRRQP